MKLNFKKDELKKILSQIYFANDGDDYEKAFWFYLKERFPNCEYYWRYFIVPFTKRIEFPVGHAERLRYRDNISPDIIKIGALHYSTSVKFFYAYNHLNNFILSSFEDFYSNIGSVCNLAEEFLLNSFILISECNNEKISILNDLKREDFLVLAGNYYDKNYAKIYSHYISKGKQPPPIRIPKLENILDEYFNDYDVWKKYKTFSQIIREFRNVIVHNVQLGKVITMNSGIVLVPKKEKIKEYDEFIKVLNITNNIKIINEDFINMKEQMILDISNLEILLNGLWIKIIEDMNKLFYEDKNESILEKYNLVLI